MVVSFNSQGAVEVVSPIFRLTPQLPTNYCLMWRGVKIQMWFNIETSSDVSVISSTETYSKKHFRSIQEKEIF